MARKIDNADKNGGFLNSYFNLIIFFAFVVILALFVSQMLYGKNSLEVYHNLKKDKQILQQKILKLQHENAQLQMQQFDLQSILPEKNEDEL
jgi:cell division protein FtsB